MLHAPFPSNSWDHHPRKTRGISENLDHWNTSSWNCFQRTKQKLKSVESAIIPPEKSAEGTGHKCRHNEPVVDEWKGCELNSGKDEVNDQIEYDPAFFVRFNCCWGEKNKLDNESKKPKGQSPHFLPLVA